MGRDLTPKYKRSRREGIELHPDLDKAGSSKSPLTRKGYFPGVHGPKGTWARRSNYGTQLREKQKAKRIYGIMERQFLGYYKKAIRKTGDTGEVMLGMLEKRLDNTVYRLGLAKTRPTARQMVTHCHVLVNGERCNIPSRQIDIGDEVSFKEAFAKKQSEQKKIDRSVPSWLSKEGGIGKMVTEPDLEDAKAMVDMRPIIEFYSR